MNPWGPSQSYDSQDTSGEKAASAPSRTHNSTIHSPCSSSCHAPSVSTLTWFLPAKARPGAISSSMEASAIQADLAEEARRRITAAIILHYFRLGRVPGTQSERMPGKGATHPCETTRRACVSSLPPPVVVVVLPPAPWLIWRTSEPITACLSSFAPSSAPPFCFPCFGAAFTGWQTQCHSFADFSRWPSCRTKLK